MTLASRQDAAIEPARAALLRDAAEQAAQAVARARDAAATMLALAQADADAAVAQAREDGAAQARPVAAVQLSQGRRAARSVTLGAELAAHDEIVARIRSAIMGLRDAPDYPELRDRLSALAAKEAGAGAVMTEHPDGGIIATAPGIVVDCSLSRLAERAIMALSEQVAALCGPSAPPAAPPAPGEDGTP